MEMGLTQEKFAEKVGIPPGAVRDIEQAYDAKITHHKKTADFFGLPFGYGVSDDLIGLVHELHGGLCARLDQMSERIDQLGQRVLQLSTRMEQLEEAMHFQRRVTRRELNSSSSLAVLGTLIPEPIRGFFVEAGFPSLSMNDVESMQAYSDDLGVQCRALGGGAVFELTVDMHDKAMAWFLNGNYSEKVKGGLGVLCAKLKSWAGWFAYDTERPMVAERFLNDAIAYARIARCPHVEIHALDNLCALLIRQGRHEQALRAAETGLVVCPSTASRTRSVFHLRALTACARRGDETGFLREMQTARFQLELGPSDSDPAWTDWGQCALSSFAGRSYVDIGQPEKGEELLRSIADRPGALSGRMEELLNAVYVARALAEQGGVAQASRHALAVLPSVLEFRSARVQRQMHELYTWLGGHRSVPQAEEFIYAYDQAVGQGGMAP